MAAKVTPLASLRVSKHKVPAHGLIPNTSIQNKPLLHYHSVFPSSTSTSDIESYLTTTGVVEPQWRYTMYSTTHFHSTTHEVLCISRGKAQLCFGGEDNPGKVETEVQRGDVVVVPAGVGHRLLRELGEEGFEMVGSYPKGCNWDMCYGKKGEEVKIKEIEKLGWFERDPVYGEKGPVLDI
ncbi:RmlC-like cupin domain-containing protein [Xylariales sp. AK1849]|nr:RmlC-like cupin domain-containing protein [Xylariales sp. AK1849]